MAYLTGDSRWITFYPKFNSSLYIEKAGYLDERPLFHTSVTQMLLLFILPILVFQSLWFLFLIPLLFLGWGKLYISLPIKTGIEDCETPAWGFDYHNNTIWFYIGGGLNYEGGKEWVTITMPHNLEWVRTSLLLKDGTWENETEGNPKYFYEEEWKNPKIVFIETHPYIDSFDNSVVNATIRVQEREWRPLAFKWTSLFAKKRRVIEIEFDEEVGNKKGEWKGGTIGCSYDLLPTETPYECLKRMEKERKF